GAQVLNALGGLLANLVNLGICASLNFLALLVSYVSPLVVAGTRDIFGVLALAAQAFVLVGDAGVSDFLYAGDGVLGYRLTLADDVRFLNIVNQVEVAGRGLADEFGEVLFELAALGVNVFLHDLF